MEGSLLTATTGCLLSSLSKLALRHGLSGLEFAVGIPGGLGGAAYMNAGAYGGEIGPLVRSAQLVQDGTVKTWQRGSSASPTAAAASKPNPPYPS